MVTWIKMTFFVQIEVENMELKLPDQRYIQHHEVIYPNHICHLDQTTTDHTWLLHEELLEHDQSSLCYQGSLWLGTIHHVNKIFQTQPTKKNMEKRDFRNY